MGELLCMHCKHEIGPGRDGFWIHVDGGFKCRVAKVLLSTFAEPPRPPSWPLDPIGTHAIHQATEGSDGGQG